MSILSKSRIICVALIVAIIATVITSLGSFTAFAATEGDYEYTVSNGKATITKYNGRGCDVIIPSTFGGYPITTIGDEAFKKCRSLTSISMPSVTNIDYLAFERCESLVNVYMPNVTTIGKGAFNDCYSLTSVNLPNATSDYQTNN